MIPGCGIRSPSAIGRSNKDENEWERLMSENRNDIVRGAIAAGEKSRRGALAFGASSLALSTIAPGAAFGRTSSRPALAEIGSDKLRGATMDGVTSLKEIPYGAPTGGANRFFAPKPDRQMGGRARCHPGRASDRYSVAWLSTGASRIISWPPCPTLQMFSRGCKGMNDLRAVGYSHRTIWATDASIFKSAMQLTPYRSTPTQVA